MILIIGAGLSGLVTAYRLKNKGIPFKILEARSRIGGRINTVVTFENTLVEMGATWFNEQHKHLIALLEEFEIPLFEQFMNDAVFFQRSPTSPTETIQIPSESPSYRISGGTSNLIDILYQKLDANDVLLNQTVTEIKWNNNTFQVIAKETFEAKKVVLAIPPKLWAKRISFEPSLPDNLIKIANQTHTWMEDSIKIALTYNQPFWELENIPSSLFSNVGPITEFYDHCDYKREKFALCGFINSYFKKLTEAERRELVLTQITSVFGHKALEFTDYQECIWSEEEFTFEATEEFLYPHQNNGNPVFRKSYFGDNLLISSSEVALETPGYMDGAVQIGNATAEKTIKSFQQN